MRMPAYPMPSESTDRHTLRTAKIFAGLSESDFRRVGGEPRLITLSPGQSLFEEGEQAQWFFVVLEGWVTLFRDRPDGARTVIHLFGPGESFAEALILPDSRYPVSAEAASGLRIAKFETARFRAFVSANPHLALSIIAATFRQLRNLVDQIEHQKGWSPRRRVASFLVRMCRPADGSCRFDLPVEQRLIAARLSMTPATLSRTLSRLADLGVDARRGQITVRDVERLSRFANGDEP